MTVLAETYTPDVLAYTGLGDYDFTYDIIGEEALEVYALNAAGDRTLIAATEYTVVLSGLAPIWDGGTVTVTGTIPADTTQLSLERNTPITQLVDFSAYWSFPSKDVEFSLDKLTMIAQEIEYRKCDCRSEAA